MDKTFLEKRIEEMAEHEIEHEWRNFINECANNPLGKHLKIGNQRLFSGQSSGQSNDVLSYYADNMKKDEYKKNSNAHEVLVNAIKERVKKKTEEILNRLSSLNYLFGERNS